MDEKNELVQQWISKANSDLKSAKTLSTAEDPILDTAIYHCQQCVEKSLKAYLTFLDVRFEKTHDLGLLGLEVAKKDPDYLPLVDLADQLSPYATLYRYPGEQEFPTNDEYLNSYKIAQTILEYVQKKLINI